MVVLPFATLLLLLCPHLQDTAKHGHEAGHGEDDRGDTSEVRLREAGKWNRRDTDDRRGLNEVVKSDGMGKDAEAVTTVISETSSIHRHSRSRVESELRSEGRGLNLNFS